MVSKTAEADFEDLREAGLNPTFRDIIRLNALALRVESLKAQFALSELPRVAFLGSVTFREPTIGSEIWLQSASRLFDENDAETFMMLRAFSLSMPQDALPDPTDEKRTLDALQSFRDSLAFATIPQLMAAVGYALHGFRGSECESPERRKDGEEDGDAEEDEPRYEIGLLRQGMVYRLGSAKDLKDLPPRALWEMIVRAMSRDHGCDARRDAVSDAEDDYLRTLDAITERLRAEKSPCNDDDGEFGLDSRCDADDREDRKTPDDEH